VYQNIKPPIKLEELYDANYLSKHGYDDAADLRLKEFHAREICRLLNPRKVLVAGCARGNAVLAFRHLGVEAWGFDIIPGDWPPDHPLRPYIKLGNILNIPYSRADGFDTLVCTDVFEHLYLRDIPRMINEIYRLGPDWLALIINHDGLSPGHVTLKPLTWWARQLQGRYELAPDLRTALVPGIYGLDPAAGRPRFTFWRKCRQHTGHCD